MFKLFQSYFIANVDADWCVGVSLFLRLCFLCLCGGFDSVVRYRRL